jgi:hypothetical protein
LELHVVSMESHGFPQIEARPSAQVATQGGAWALFSPVHE